ncbi:MAG: PstS family phosphate ABC transporter substrate-binding protein [Xenococcaceae cyanobacterium]
MKTTTPKSNNFLIFITLGIAATALLSASTKADSQQNASILIDGSSTVYPITQAVVQEFKTSNKQPVDLNVNFSGTSGGFKKFCAGETDISNASRPILTKEMEACKQAGVAYIELPIAFDALTIVVNPQNDWLKSLTTEDLKKIWEPAAEKKITRWNQISPNFPNSAIALFGPGKDSGTFDYFTEAIVGKVDSSRTDYTASEDDNVLVKGVSQDPNALGYFGLAYYESRAKDLKAVAIDSGKGAVLPSRQTVEAAQYQPLSRPLFIYVNSSAAQKKPELRKFVEYYLEKAPQTVSSVGYVPLPDDGYYLTKIHFQRGKVGTVFGGKSEFNLTIGELLRKQATF